jgi:VIT family
MPPFGEATFPATPRLPERLLYVKVGKIARPFTVRPGATCAETSGGQCADHRQGIAGRCIPLGVYMLLATASAALGVSVAITLMALGVFGYVKGRFTGALSSQERPASSPTTSRRSVIT